MALRLLLLRSTEQLTDDLRKRKASAPTDTPVLSASVLAEVLDVVRNCASSRLQFASLVLEVGRQLEPSCFPNLFPLPISQQPNNGGNDSNNLRTVKDVFRACLEDGSLLCSVSSLPIIPGSSLSREKSMLLLKHCLGAFNKNSDLEADFFFDFSMEERSMLRDIFRFGAKLEDSGIDDLDVLSSDEVSVASSSDSSHSSDDDDDANASRRKGYSLACGMLNLSWFSSKPNPSQQNLGGRAKSNRREREKLLRAQGSPKKGRRGKENDKNSQNKLGNVAGTVALLLVKLTVPVNDQLPRAYSWKRASALAFLLLGQEQSLLPMLSAKDCTRLAKSSVTINIDGHQTSNESSSVEDRLAALLTRCMVSCSTEIGTVASGKLLDLILVILARIRQSSDFDSLLPGLLVIGITAGHVSNRVQEILDIENNKSIPFARCYLMAKDKAESLHSF